MSDELFEQDCTLGLDKISEKYEHFILLGDLNFNMLDGPKSEKLKDVCDIFDLSNIVKNPTCFTSRNKVSKVAKIRNRYNQVPHLTQDTKGKVTNSQKTPQTRAKRSALSQQVTTKHI